MSKNYDAVIKYQYERLRLAIKEQSEATALIKWANKKKEEQKHDNKVKT